MNDTAISATRREIHPRGWARPSGYTPGILAAGTVHVAGQVGWNGETQSFQSDDLVDQIEQALRNTAAILAEAGAKPTDIVRMTWYVLDVQEYKSRTKEIGRVYRSIIGKHFPAMAVVQVSALVEDRAKFEVESTAEISP